MISVESFTEPVNYNHWDMPPLSGYIYHNVLTPTVYQHLVREIRQIITDNSNKNSFLTNVTIIHDNERGEIKLGTNIFNNRYQNVIYDLNFHPEYWYQTQDTILDWGLGVIKNTCSPGFIKYIHTMLTVEPFKTHKWLPYRLHINYLPHEEGLGVHIDSNHMIFKNDFDKSRQLSVTYYLEDQKESLGGELYTINGFCFKQKKNTAIAINGHQVPHGVTHNVTNEARLAFTSRWAHIDDLFLPGHPDKHLYKLDHL